jgi:uncharacterized membrane protein
MSSLLTFGDARTVLGALAFLVVFVIADLIFLGVIARSFYRAQLGPLLREKFHVPAAILFYLAYTFGVAFFVLAPSRASAWPVTTALINGAALGFTAYATYNLTNMATLKGWPKAMTVLDMLWGTVATALVAALVTMLVLR